MLGLIFKSLCLWAMDIRWCVEHTQMLQTVSIVIVTIVGVM
jgi:hypothetical protein